MLGSFPMRVWVRGWLDASLRNRVGAALVALSLGLVLFLGSASFIYIFSLTLEATRAALEESARDAANELAVAISASRDDLSNLARNPTVVSAVLDSAGQESYLYPLLSRFSPDGRTPRTLCVTDYKGQSVGCAKQPKARFDNSPAVMEAMAGNRPAARIVAAEPNRPLLLIAYPVVYEGTGSAEGAVVAEYALRDVILHAVHGADRLAHLHLHGTSGDVFLLGKDDSAVDEEGIVNVELPLPLSGELAKLDLRISLGVPRETLAAPLWNLAAIFSGLALVVVGVVVSLVHYLTPRLTDRLLAITRQAQAVAETGQLDAEFDESGRDEIARLAQSFAKMTKRLKGANLALESTVEARTNELRQQRALLQSILDTVPGVIFQCHRRADGTFAFPFISQALEDIAQIDGAPLRDDGAPLFALIHADDRDALMASLEDSARRLSPWRKEYRIVRPDGAIRWCSGRALPQRENGGVTWNGVVTDTTEHKTAELALAESEAYSKALFESSYIPLIILDPESGRFVDCNDAAVSIYGFPDRQAVLGRTPIDVSAPTQYDGRDSSVCVQEQIAEASARGIKVFEWRHRRPDGTIWDAEVRLMTLIHRGRALMQFSLIDITERKRLEDARRAHEDLIWRQANFDALTGLANRNLCYDRLEGALAQARRSGRKVGVLFVDLDGFKTVNDTVGHALGDELLIGVARRLSEVVREQDTVARLGGDEFVLLVHDLANAQDMLGIGEKIVATLQQPFSLAGTVFTISASIGTALFPDDATDGESLLDLADQAMYQAKQAGKNCVRAAGLL